jgi:hypothetical protein
VPVLNAVLGWYDALRFASDSGRQEIFQREKFFVRAFAWGGPAGQRQSLAFITGNPDKVKVLIEYYLGQLMLPFRDLGQLMLPNPDLS